MLAIFFMLVVLKIPVILMIWLVFWASNNNNPTPPGDEGGGGPDCGGRPTPPVVDCGPRLRIANSPKIPPKRPNRLKIGK